MKLFSQRRGLKPIKSVVQIDSIDEDLRNNLWNALSISYWNYMENSYDTRYRSAFRGEIVSLCKVLWLDYFKKPVDTMSIHWSDIYKQLRDYFFGCKWYEIYDFIEFIANNFEATYPYEDTNSEFMRICSSLLKREVSAYRFVGGKITQITSEEEIVEIEEALKPDKLKPIRTQLKKALDLLADRKSPDYSNSIKESISAVETLCRYITKKPKATLGDALKIIEKNVGIHGALKDAFSKLYGYTSDEQGIRHSLMDVTNLDFEDAKFMLVACSAFINYLVVKSSKAKIKF